MKTPFEAQATLAGAQSRMQPEQVASHAVALAKCLVSCDALAWALSDSYNALAGRVAATKALVGDIAVLARELSAKIDRGEIELAAAMSADLADAVAVVADAVNDIPAEPVEFCSVETSWPGVFSPVAAQ